MKSWECDFAGQGGNAHEHCNGEKKTGSLSDSEVMVWQCSCACHGENRDGHYLRNFHDHGDGEQVRDYLDKRARGEA